MSHPTTHAAFEQSVARVGHVDFKRGRLICSALVIVGLASFALMLFSGQVKQAWQSYLVNLVFFLGIAQAGIVWAAITRTTRGTKWASSLVRYGEALSAFLPIGYALVLIFLFAGGATLYPWVKEPVAAKAAWLNWPFFVARSAILMGVSSAAFLLFWIGAFLYARLNPLWALSYPLGAVVFAWILAEAAWNGSRVSWKGRAYVSRSS